MNVGNHPSLSPDPNATIIDRSTSSRISSVPSGVSNSTHDRDSYSPEVAGVAGKEGREAGKEGREVR